MISGFTGEWSFLSNFYLSPFTAQGMGWQTVEHYYQAMKTVDHQMRNRIREERTPGAAKRLGRRVELRPDWEQIKLAVMRRALELKFPTPYGTELFLPEGEHLSIRLMRTAPHLLVEFNTWNDRYWGVTDQGGQNWLGYLLMARRAELIGTGAR